MQGTVLIKTTDAFIPQQHVEQLLALFKVATRFRVSSRLILYFFHPK